MGCVPVLLAETDAPHLYPYEPFLLSWHDLGLSLAKESIPHLESVLAWDTER